MTINPINEFDRIRCSFSREALINIHTKVSEVLSRKKDGSPATTKDILTIPKGFIGLLAPPEIRANDVLIDISPTLLLEYPALFNANNIRQVPRLLFEVFEINPQIFFDTSIVHYIEITKDLYPLCRPKSHYLVAIQNNNNPHFQIRAYANNKIKFYNFQAPETIELRGTQSKPPFRVNVYDKYAQITDNRTNESFLKSHPDWLEIERHFNESFRYELQPKTHDSIRYFFDLPDGKPPFLKDILVSQSNPCLDSFRAFYLKKTPSLLDEYPFDKFTPTWKLAIPTIDRIITDSQYDPQSTVNGFRAFIGGSNYRLEQKVLHRLSYLKSGATKLPIPTILAEIEYLLTHGLAYDGRGVL
jgi:hypothetical protein